MSKKSKIVLVIVCAVALLVGGCGIGFLLDHGKADEKLETIQLLIDQYYLEDTEEVEFEEGVYKGYMEQLGDPYSVYYTKEEYDALMEDSSGVYCGIGATPTSNANEPSAVSLFDIW